MLLASCSPIVENYGHQWDSDDFKQIIEGQSGKDDVKAVLGTPSTTGDFGSNVWYYISTKRERVAFFKPEIVEQDVVAVLFDEEDHVKRVSRFNTKDKREVVIVGKVTPAEGKEMGILEQFLGNLGRFNAPGGRQPGQTGR